MAKRKQATRATDTFGCDFCEQEVAHVGVFGTAYICKACWVEEADGMLRNEMPKEEAIRWVKELLRVVKT